MFARLKIHSGGSKRTCPQSGLTVKFCFPYVTDAQAVLFESISEQYDGEAVKNRLRKIEIQAEYKIEHISFEFRDI